jgi:hypothetical protein
MRALLWSYLGWRRFLRELSAFEVRQFFSFSPEDRHALRRRFRRRARRLGAAIQLGFVRITGAVLDIIDHVPRPVLAYGWSGAPVFPNPAHSRCSASASPVSA